MCFSFIGFDAVTMYVEEAKTSKALQKLLVFGHKECACPYSPHPLFSLPLPLPLLQVSVLALGGGFSSLDGAFGDLG